MITLFFYIMLYWRKKYYNFGMAELSITSAYSWRAKIRNIFILLKNNTSYQYNSFNCKVTFILFDPHNNPEWVRKGNILIVQKNAYNTDHLSSSESKYREQSRYSLGFLLSTLDMWSVTHLQMAEVGEFLINNKGQERKAKK